jgi:nicotinic acid phosphoribosyltransferase
VVDAYGVGTSITNARVIDFAMDIIGIEGKPLAKRGKISGAKGASMPPVLSGQNGSFQRKRRPSHSRFESMLVWRPVQRASISSPSENEDPLGPSHPTGDRGICP